MAHLSVGVREDILAVDNNVERQCVPSLRGLRNKLSEVDLLSLEVEHIGHQAYQLSKTRTEAFFLGFDFVHNLVDVVPVQEAELAQVKELV